MAPAAKETSHHLECYACINHRAQRELKTQIRGRLL